MLLSNVPSPVVSVLGLLQYIKRDFFAFSALLENSYEKFHNCILVDTGDQKVIAVFN